MKLKITIIYFLFQSFLSTYGTPKPSYTLTDSLRIKAKINRLVKKLKNQISDNKENDKLGKSHLNNYIISDLVRGSFINGGETIWGFRKTGNGLYTEGKEFDKIKTLLNNINKEAKNSEGVLNKKHYLIVTSAYNSFIDKRFYNPVTGKYDRNKEEIPRGKEVTNPLANFRQTSWNNLSNFPEVSDESKKLYNSLSDGDLNQGRDLYELQNLILKKVNIGGGIVVHLVITFYSWELKNDKLKYYIYDTYDATGFPEYLLSQDDLFDLIYSNPLSVSKKDSRYHKLYNMIKHAVDCGKFINKIEGLRTIQGKRFATKLCVWFLRNQKRFPKKEISSKDVNKYNGDPFSDISSEDVNKYDDKSSDDLFFYTISRADDLFMVRNSFGGHNDKKQAEEIYKLLEKFSTPYFEEVKENLVRGQLIKLDGAISTFSSFTSVTTSFEFFLKAIYHKQPYVRTFDTKTISSDVGTAKPFPGQPNVAVRDALRRDDSKLLKIPTKLFLIEHISDMERYTLEFFLAFMSNRERMRLIDIILVQALKNNKEYFKALKRICICIEKLENPLQYLESDKEKSKLNKNDFFYLSLYKSKFKTIYDLTSKDSYTEYLEKDHYKKILMTTILKIFYNKKKNLANSTINYQYINSQISPTKEEIKKVNAAIPSDIESGIMQRFYIRNIPETVAKTNMEEIRFKKIWRVTYLTSTYDKNGQLKYETHSVDVPETKIFKNKKLYVTHNIFEPVTVKFVDKLPEEYVLHPNLEKGQVLTAPAIFFYWLFKREYEKRHNLNEYVVNKATSYTLDIISTALSIGAIYKSVRLTITIGSRAITLSRSLMHAFAITNATLGAIKTSFKIFRDYCEGVYGKVDGAKIADIYKKYEVVFITLNDVIAVGKLFNMVRNYKVSLKLFKKSLPSNIRELKVVEDMYKNRSEVEYFLSTIGKKAVHQFVAKPLAVKDGLEGFQHLTKLVITHTLYEGINK